MEVTMDVWEKGPIEGHVEYPVNGVTVRFDDPIVTGREVLNAAGLMPASEHQLILVRGGRTRLVGTDDKIDLRAEVGGQLRAFLSDRSFSFTVAEIGEVWGVGEMEVDEFLPIWVPPEGHHWVLERADEPDTILRHGGVISFEPGGVEHIVAQPHHGPDKVLVVVVTTAGLFPAEGANRYPVTEIIANVLARAAKKLEIADTADWTVTVGGRDIDAALSFAQAGLTGEIDLEWGAPEGGGGHV
jgi:hypothetical protein